MRFAVDPWDPSYGTSSEADPDGAEAAPDVDVDVEVLAEIWAPIAPDPRHNSAGGIVVFIDGVRRVDARIWVTPLSGEPVAGVCASWAAGAVECRPGRPPVMLESEVGRTLAAAVPEAQLESLEFSLAHNAVMASIVDGPGGEATTDSRRRRAPITYRPATASAETPEALWIAVQEQMGRAERRISEQAVFGRDDDALVVLDGTLRGRDHLAGVVAMVKSHQVRYLTGVPAQTLARLAAGQRTPVFKILGAFDRYSWYVRLPTESAEGVPFAGVVRCEVSSTTPLDDVLRRADQVTVELQRYASEPHKDRRAPQNLYPIAGLERDLRHRLGDVAILYRALRSAASASR